MKNTKTPIKFNSRDLAIVNALKANPDGLTVSELSEATGLKLVAGHIVSAKNKGLVEAIGEKRIYRDSTHLVETYAFVTAEPQVNTEGKTFNYTENEKSILDAVKDLDATFTLKNIAVAMGKDKLSTGSILGLVKKGNIVKTGEKATEPCKVPATVNVYALVGDIPADAAIENV